MATHTRETRVRDVNSQEIEELEAFLAEEFENQENIDNWADHAYITVFPNYQTDGPGYAGRVIVVVYGGSPATPELYIWNEGKLV